MHTLYAFACLALLHVTAVHAALSQKAQYPGLADLLDLGQVLPKTRVTFSGTPDGADCSNSDCQGSMATTTASFADTDHTILVCNCQGSQLNRNALVVGLSQVPLFLRRHVKSITAIPADADQVKALTNRITGQMTFFGFLPFDVFIHEAAHAQDKGFSSGSTFKDALAADSCVPDAFAQNNEQEAYAQGRLELEYMPTTSNSRACIDRTLCKINFCPCVRAHPIGHLCLNMKKLTIRVNV